MQVSKMIIGILCQYHLHVNLGKAVKWIDILFQLDMIRLLSITRSGALVVSMSDLFLSISTGLMITLHYNYFVPLISADGNEFSLYSVLYSMLFVSVGKGLFEGVFAFFYNKKQGSKNTEAREIPLRKLVYTVAIKVAAYLCFILLLLTINGVTFSLVIFLTFLFIFSLEYCSNNDLITKILWKGRSLGANKLKTFLLGVLVLGSIILQPLSYDFIFELHFEIFIVFTSSLMFFSYYYLHKLLLTVTPKDHVPQIMWQMSALECLFIVLLATYYALMEENGLAFADQLSNISENILLMVGLLLLSFIYEVVLVESLKKVAVNRLIITQISGILWFNIYAMSQAEIELRHYISAIVLLFVLLVNIELFSESNMKSLLAVFNHKKKKRAAFTEMEMKESENDH